MATKREKLLSITKSLFTDRIVEIKVFREFIASNSYYYDLLHVMGIGGIGKTTLLEAFGTTCEEMKFAWVLINVGDQELPAQLLRLIYDRLTSSGQLKLNDLETQLHRHDELDRKVRTEGNIPSELLSIILTGMTSSTKRNTGISDFQEASQAMSYLTKVLGNADAEFYLNPVSTFTKALLTDLAGLTDQRVCLMFDRYELISSFLDEWIRVELFPNLQDHVFVVTSGRKPLPIEWQEWLPIIRVMELAPLTSEDTQALVRLRGVADERAIREIADFADGLPLAAGMAADLLRESGAVRLDLSGATGHLSIVGELVQKLTHEVPAELREWLEQCAIVRWFNEDTLEQFIGIPKTKVAEVYTRLDRLSFVRSHPTGLAMHDLVREFISGDIAKRSKRRFADLHQKAATYYEQLITEAHQKSQPLAVELVYHLLRADENAGVARLRELFENAADFAQIEFSTALLETTRGLEVQKDNQLWLEYFAAAIGQQKNVDNLKSARLLEALISRPEIDRQPELKARVAAYLPMALWYIAEFQPALYYAQIGQELAASLGLVSKQNRALEVLGLTFDRLGKFEDAIASQSQLLELTRQTNDRMGEAWALNNLGFFSWHAGKWTQAEAYLLQCQSLMLDLQSPYGIVYPLGHLGLLYVAVGRLEDAERALLKGLHICEEEKNLEMKSNILQNLADMYHANGELEKALDSLDKALQVNHILIHPYFDSDCYRRRGNCLLSTDRYEEAAASYTEGFMLAEKIEAEYMRLWMLADFKILSLRGWKEKISPDTENLVSMCLQRRYYDILSDLKWAEAEVLFSEGNLEIGQQGSLDALIYGMLYNRYWLYNQLNKLIGLVREWQRDGKSEEAQKVLSTVLTRWGTETYQDHSLQSLEEDARAREPGLMPLPPTVVEQIRQALKMLT